VGLRMCRRGWPPARNGTARYYRVLMPNFEARALNCFMKISTPHQVAYNPLSAGNFLSSTFSKKISRSNNFLIGFSVWKSNTWTHQVAPVDTCALQFRRSRLLAENTAGMLNPAWNAKRGAAHQASGESHPGGTEQACGLSAQPGTTHSVLGQVLSAGKRPRRTRCWRYVRGHRCRCSRRRSRCRGRSPASWCSACSSAWRRYASTTRTSGSR
jgi:hypothetical protein